MSHLLGAAAKAASKILKDEIQDPRGLLPIDYMTLAELVVPPAGEPEKTQRLSPDLEAVQAVVDRYLARDLGGKNPTTHDDLRRAVEALTKHNYLIFGLEGRLAPDSCDERLISRHSC